MLTNNYNLYQNIINFMALSRQRRPSVRLSPINIDLQLNLLNTWTRFKVAEYYQNIVLTHLDEHGSQQAQEHIKKQIKLTLQRKSPYFQLQRLQQQRKNLLTQLQQRLSSQTATDTSQSLSTICSDLKQLRDLNLLTAEHIIKIYNIYRCTSPQSIQKQMEYYDSMLEKLDQDNQFLKDSFLNQYIQFDQSYDPFLMAQYENTHRNKMNQMETPIKDLYAMNISYAYRLMKTKNTILELRSMAKRKDMADEQMNTSYRFRYKPGKTKSQLYQPKQQSMSNTEIVPTERMTLKDNQSLRIKPIQVYPSPKPKPRATYQQDSRIASFSQINQSNRLNFMKIEPLSQSRASSIPAKPFPSVQKQPKYFLDSRANGFDSSIVKDINVFEKKRSISKAPSISVEPHKQGKYKVGIGEIYQTAKLTPSKQPKNRTEPDQNSQRPDLHLEMLKAKNKQILEERSHRSRKAQVLNKKQSAEEEVESEQNDKQSDEDNEIDPNPKFKKVRYYNPIKKQQFSLLETINRQKKYDYNPQEANPKKKTKTGDYNNNADEIVQDDQVGLLYESPISKYNIRPKKITPKPTQKTIEPNTAPKASQKGIQKDQESQIANSKRPTLIDQEAQTMELNKNKNDIKKNPEPKKASVPPNKHNIMYQSQDEPDSQAQASKINQTQKKPVQVKEADRAKANQTPNTANKNQSSSSRAKPQPQINPPQENLQTLEEEDIIDERPSNTSQKPLIRSAQNDLDKKDNVKPITPQTTPKGSNYRDSSVQRAQNSSQLNGAQGDKKQIRIKIGKSSLPEVVALLEKIKLNQKYKQSFEISKIIQWVKVSQTYLVQFHFNQQPGVVALCSPIPNVGIALKLWTPVREDITENVSISLFNKYIEFIQRNTTTEKIVFSGKPFPELTAAGFAMKKDNLYERTRKIPAKPSEAEFKPFLYIECSNIRFEHRGEQKILYSEEIEEFSQSNFYATRFLAQADPARVPLALQPLVKHTPGLADFKAVNAVLTQEEFDSYEADELSTTNIDLMRFYLSSPLKSTFVAQDGFLRFTGTLVHDKASECIVSVPTMKSNGQVFFCKGLEWASVLELTKKTSTNRIQFSVMMFSKKLYGRMTASPKGCYGNWEVNLTWEDELQGRVRHSMNEAKNFGPNDFKVLIRLESEVVLGFDVSKKDSIL